MKRPQYRPPTPLQTTISRLHREIWEHKHEITNLEIAIERLTKLQEADEKAIEERDKAAAAALKAVAAQKKPPGKTEKRDNGRISAAARKRIAAAQKKRWIEHRRQNAAKAAPASPAKLNFAARIQLAANADDARAILSEHEAAIHNLQLGIGMKPTVGEIDPRHSVGFSVVKPNEWKKVVAQAKDRSPSKAAQLQALISEGYEAHRLFGLKFYPELAEKPRTMTAGGGDAE